LERPWTCMYSWPNTKHLGFTYAASKVECVCDFSFYRAA
jgi:hypothetical protein